MGRWRPPAEKSSPYITAEGYSRLSEELRYLWKTKRPEVTQALSDAAAEGDRSENAEYIYRKKELREIDRRIRYLSKRLDGIKVIDQRPADQSRIYFGAWVRLIDEQEQIVEYRIVGADEIDPKRGYISIDAPLARQLLKRSAGDEVELKRADGTDIWFEIEAVWYQE